MALPHPQPLQDWLTQAWNIALGEPMGPADDWLAGPFGRPGGIHEKFIAELAAREGLSIDRSNTRTGLVDDFSPFPGVHGRVHPRILDFYTATPAYALDVWSRWTPGFHLPGRWVNRLFSRRIGQLNLPENPLDTALGLSSEVILLRAPDGRIRHRIWLRRLLRNGLVLYCGLYTQTRRPGGEPCLKIIFPLPHGNATVLMRLRAGDDGSLDLESRGTQCGEPGFYFLLEDRLGGGWKHYLRAFHEHIRVYVDPAGVVRADHTMSLWNQVAFALHYRVRPAPEAAPAHSTRHITSSE